MTNPKTPHADEDVEYCEEGVEALPSGPPSGNGSAEELSNALLEMCAKASAIIILVRELDDSEYAAVAGRIRAFLGLVAQIPTAPVKKAKRVGFKVDKKKRSKKRR